MKERASTRPSPTISEGSETSSTARGERSLGCTFPWPRGFVSEATEGEQREDVTNEVRSREGLRYGSLRGVEGGPRGAQVRQLEGEQGGARGKQ